MKSTHECDIEQGIERDIEQGEQQSALRLIEAKLGPMSADVKQHVEALFLQALAQLQLDLLESEDLEEILMDD